MSGMTGSEKCQKEKSQETMGVVPVEYTGISGLRTNSFGGLMLDPEKPRVLLHACCGPCATACVERIAFDYSVTVFYYNPNITDSEEYYLRRDNLRKFLDGFNRDHKDETFVDYMEGPYDTWEYLKRAEPLKEEPEGGKRCTVCFEMRLAETARTAESLGFDYFTTTMTVSPHKNYQLISQIGNALGEGMNADFLDIDFKKKDGFRRSVELSKKYGLYRQRFCGCEYARDYGLVEPARR